MYEINNNFIKNKIHNKINKDLDRCKKLINIQYSIYNEYEESLGKLKYNMENIIDIDKYIDKLYLEFKTFIKSFYFTFDDDNSTIFDFYIDKDTYMKYMKETNNSLIFMVSYVIDDIAEKYQNTLHYINNMLLIRDEFMGIDENKPVDIVNTLFLCQGKIVEWINKNEFIVDDEIYTMDIHAKEMFIIKQGE